MDRSTCNDHALVFLSSTLHLGNPQRAMACGEPRRSSWLSREGCMCFITYVPLCLLAAMSIFYDAFDLTLGYVGADLLPDHGLLHGDDLCVPAHHCQLAYKMTPPSIWRFH